MPECRNGLCQDIPSADEIGIAPVIAGDTSEHLSLAVAPVLLTTCGAIPKGFKPAQERGIQQGRHGYEPAGSLFVCSRTSSMIWSVVTPSASASNCKKTRWRSAGRAMAVRSSNATL